MRQPGRVTPGESIISIRRSSQSGGVSASVVLKASKLDWSAGTHLSRLDTSGGRGLTQPVPEYALAKYRRDPHM